MSNVAIDMVYKCPNEVIEEQKPGGARFYYFMHNEQVFMFESKMPDWMVNIKIWIIKQLF